jgi:LacI family transcriptional regulator
MRVTIKDIAKKTGLSVSTVSLVLNHKKHRISEETCRRVMQAAEELHYRPNQMAVGLITKKTRTIGLIVPDVTNMFFAEIAKGAEAQCQKSGYSIILCNTNDNPEKDIDYINVLMDRGVDGILFTMAVNSTTNKASECIKIFNQFEKPAILVDRVLNVNNSDNGFPSVTVDNELGGYLATCHLLELGHRKIGCITGPMGAQSSQQRLFGYIRALQEFNCPFDQTLIKEGDYHTSSGQILFKEFFKQGVTAVFAFNDMIAYGVYCQAKKIGLHIPQDLSIVGFDDLPFSEILETPLTSMKQPAYEIGECAVKKMIEKINNPQLQTKNTVFKPELIVRKSTSQIIKK